MSATSSSTAAPRSRRPNVKVSLPPDDALVPDQLYEKRYVARRLSVSIATIDRWIVADLVHVVRLGYAVRIRGEEIIRILNEGLK